MTPFQYIYHKFRDYLVLTVKLDLLFALQNFPFFLFYFEACGPKIAIFSFVLRKALDFQQLEKSTNIYRSKESNGNN